MKNMCLLALMGAWMGFALTFPQITYGDHIQTELHALYKQKAYFDCLKKAHHFAKEDRRSPIPPFYAALAVCHYEEDPAIKIRINNPMSRALGYLEEAKRRDASGAKLAPVRKGLAWMQRKMFNGARTAYEKGNRNLRPFFDRMHKLFSSRKGTWRNLYHAGTDAYRSDYDFTEWDNPFFRMADTGAQDRTLDRETRELIYLHNLCRIDPPRFERTFLRKYLRGHNYSREEATYVASLQEYLKKMEPAGFLYPGKCLKTAAEAHGRDLSRSGTFDHDGPTGESFSERLDRFKVPPGARAENLAAGYDEAIDCFFALLIDIRVKSLGHRYSMTSDSYNYIGVGISQEEGGWKIWVFDFSKEI